MRIKRFVSSVMCFFMLNTIGGVLASSNEPEDNLIADSNGSDVVDCLAIVRMSGAGSSKQLIKDSGGASGDNAPSEYEEDNSKIRIPIAYALCIRSPFEELSISNEFAGVVDFSSGMNADTLYSENSKNDEISVSYARSN